MMNVLVPLRHISAAEKITSQMIKEERISGLSSMYITQSPVAGIIYDNCNVSFVLDC